MKTAGWLALAWCWVWCLCSCSAAAGFGTSPHEHALYRRARTAEALDDRLDAASRYLRAYPEGAWAAELRRSFDEAERAWFGELRTTEAGLRTYLATLPQGPHADEARDLYLAARSRATRREELETVGELAGRIDARAADRARAVAAFESWVAAFSRDQAFARPLSELEGDVIVGWALGAPRPVCKRDEARDERECFQIVSRGFTIVSDGVDSPRELTLERRVRQSFAGAPRQVVLAGPELFVRLEEARSGRAVGSREGAARAWVEAVRVKAAASTDASCVPATDARAALSLRCSAVRIRVVLGASPADDDRVEFTHLR